jgi:hypothetical protein
MSPASAPIADVILSIPAPTTAKEIRRILISQSHSRNRQDPSKEGTRT